MPRLKIEGSNAVYHCIARVVGGQLLLHDLEKERLRQQLWEYAEFCGVEIVTYCVMSNHFHVLVRVPDSIAMSDEALLKKVRKFYGAKSPLVRAAQESVAKELKNVTCFDTDDFELYNKGHYNHNGQIKLGNTFAQHFLRVVEGSK